MHCSIIGRRGLCMMELIFRRLKLDRMCGTGIEIERSRCFDTLEAAGLLFCSIFMFSLLFFF